MARTKPRFDETLALVMEDGEVMLDVYRAHDPEAVVAGLILTAYSFLPAHWSIQRKADWIVAVAQLTGGIIPKLAIN